MILVHRCQLQISTAVWHWFTGLLTALVWFCDPTNETKCLFDYIQVEMRRTDGHWSMSLTYSFLPWYDRHQRPRSLLVLPTYPPAHVWETTRAHSMFMMLWFQQIIPKAMHVGDSRDTCAWKSARWPWHFAIILISFFFYYPVIYLVHFFIVHGGAVSVRSWVILTERVTVSQLFRCAEVSGERTILFLLMNHLAT
jgi:hypothetical protein